MYREDDRTIQIYMREIGESALLTREEEGALAARIHAGDEEARQLMIRSNLRLVVKIAHAYARLGLPLLDLISEGNLGLMKAVDRFDPALGGKMSTYAAWWIKQSIRRALANQSKTIRLPSHLVDKIGRMRKAEQRLAAELGREPDDDELATEVGVEVATITQWRTLTLKPASLDAPIRDGDGQINDLVADPKAVSPHNELADKQLREEVDPLLDLLSVREREILKRRFGLLGTKIETLVRIGARFDITRERVRQIQNEAIAKLREMMEEQDQPRPEGVPDRRWSASSAEPAAPDAQAGPAAKSKSRRATSRSVARNRRGKHARRRGHEKN